MHSWLTRCSIGLTSIALVGATFLLPAPAQAAGTDIEVTPPPAANVSATAEPEATAPVSDEVQVEQTTIQAAPKQDDEPEPESEGDEGGDGEGGDTEDSVERVTVDPFRMAGVTWDASSDATDVTVRVQVRTNGTWGSWETLEIEDSDEAGRPGTAPLWTEAPADAIAVDVQAASGTPEGVKVTTIDPGKDEVVTPVKHAAYDPDEDESVTEEVAADGTPTVVPMPSIITRAQWKAGAGTSCSAPTTRPKALGVTIHHTAGSNTYTKAESAGIIRSYQTYHVKGHGWCDIGYSFLVDRFGQIFEGRKGGITKQVRGAHAGVNAVNEYSTGISMMGHLDHVQPSAAMQAAVVKLVGWRLKYFGANPKGTFTAGGKTYKVIHGHRDALATACPGKYGYAWLNAVGGLRDRVAAYLSKATSAAGAPTPAPAPAVTYATPKNVKLVAGTTSIKATWDAVPGAPGYRVALSADGTGNGAVFYHVTSNSLNISSLNSRRTFVVRVSVYNAATKERLGGYTGKPFPTTRTRAFTAPRGIKLTSRGSTAMKFTWPAQAGAPGYRFMYVPKGKTTGKRYVTTYTNSVTIKKLKPRTRYDLRVAVVYPRTGERVSGYTAKPIPSAITAKAGAKATTVKKKATAVSAKNSVAPSGGKVTFKGHGYGHGIGMSQYGAEGGARAGKKYNQILSHYYPGTKLSDKSATIRVLISADTTDSVYVQPKSGLKLRTLANNKVETLPTAVSGRKVSAWSIDTAKETKKKNSVYYKSGSTWYTYRTFATDAQFEGPTSIALVMPNGSARAFRGALRSTKPTATSRDTVNVLNLEDYTRGVVAREMPSSWHLEALKAQSVAARTFGARYLGSTKHYDICDTTSCQVYGGVADETSRTNSAINGTKGKILTYDGAAALTQFSSSSGGYTNAGSAPYLKPVSDPWNNWSGSKWHSWSQAVSASTIQKKYPNIGTLKSVTVTKRNGYGALGGRVVSMTLQGSKGTKTISGVDARWAFGLRSDWFGF